MLFRKNSEKTDIQILETSQISLSKFKLRAALKLCINLFFAEWCWTLFSSTNSIFNRSSRYFTNLKMKVRHETFTDQLHRDAYMILKAFSNFRDNLFYFTIFLQTFEHSLNITEDN